MYTTVSQSVCLSASQPARSSLHCNMEHYQRFMLKGKSVGLKSCMLTFCDISKVKVKLSVCFLTEHHAMKRIGRVEV
jgi:hypothetical protein